MVQYTWCQDCSAGKRITHIDWDSWVYFSVIPIPQSVNSSISGPLYVVISLLLVSSIGEEELNVQREIGLGGAATLRSLTARPVNRTLLTAVATLQEENHLESWGRKKLNLRGREVS